MRRIILLKGLPGSGKTTFAKKILQESKNIIKRINKDDLRAMIDDSKWSKQNEKFIMSMRDAFIDKAIYEGYDVIVDDTNLHPKHETHLKELFKGKAEVEVITLNTPLHECIERDSKREGKARVGSQVILKMYNDYLRPTYRPPEGKPKAFIFDIDGTLAKMKDRGPFDWKKVGQDELCIPVFTTLKALENSGYHILIFSGRDGSCYAETTSWLTQNGIFYDSLSMREKDNTEKDYIVKERMFDQIKDDYQIVGVFDDRPQVIRMWKSLGLHVFDCGDGIDF